MMFGLPFRPLRPALFTVVFACGWLCLPASLDGGQAIRMRVSPAVSMAPGYVTVRVNIEPDAQNRVLEVVTESSDFYRGSQVSLNGANGSPLNVFEFRNLPTGVYHVTSVVVGVNGPRGTAMAIAKVEPSPGR